MSRPHDSQPCTNDHSRRCHDECQREIERAVAHAGRTHYYGDDCVPPHIPPIQDRLKPLPHLTEDEAREAVARFNERYPQIQQIGKQR